MLSYSHNKKFCANLGTSEQRVASYAYLMIKFDGKNKYYPCQSTSQWDLQSHKQYGHHSNLLGHYLP
jgi:hypothetical protein